MAGNFTTVPVYGKGLPTFLHRLNTLCTAHQASHANTTAACAGVGLWRQRQLGSTWACWAGVGQQLGTNLSVSRPQSKRGPRTQVQSSTFCATTSSPHGLVQHFKLSHVCLLLPWGCMFSACGWVIHPTFLRGLGNIQIPHRYIQADPFNEA